MVRNHSVQVFRSGPTEDHFLSVKAGGRGLVPSGVIVLGPESVGFRCLGLVTYGIRPRAMHTYIQGRNGTHVLKINGGYTEVQSYLANFFFTFLYKISLPPSTGHVHGGVELAGTTEIVHSQLYSLV